MTDPTPIFPVCAFCGEYRGLDHDPIRCETIARTKKDQITKCPDCGKIMPKSHHIDGCCEECVGRRLLALTTL